MLFSNQSREIQLEKVETILILSSIQPMTGDTLTKNSRLG